MIAQLPPMGWNTWNTFGKDINEALILQTAEVMVNRGYLAAGYNYLVIDDCWSLMERGADGHLKPDPAKFPHGMKYVADEVHKHGLKFGMYSCAGVRTCGGYPSSYDHEYVDAQDFADWGVDFLKYDFCNFPKSGDCKMRYLTMSMALKATGREILFSACNWGSQEPWRWMRSIGAHMYRSTGDIMDNYVSFSGIAKSQIENLCMSGSYCFNDMDMLTVGMYGKGNVQLGRVCTYEEYRQQFALWCLFGVPLMMGADIRTVEPKCEALMKNTELIAIDQDPECRAPYLVRRGDVMTRNPDPKPGEYPWMSIPDCGLVFMRHLTNNEFVLAYFNFHDEESEIPCIFADAGVPAMSGYGLRMKNVLTDEDIGVKCDSYNPHVAGHDCLLLRCRLEKANA